MRRRSQKQQLYLFADRTSSAAMRANQSRLWFSSLAYVFMNELRRVGLRRTKLAQTTCQTMRLKLLKIGGECEARKSQLRQRLSKGTVYSDFGQSA
jgi:hypothetical protein